MPGVTTQPDGATGPADAAAPASSSSDRLSTDHHIGPVLFSAEQLAQRIALLGAQITEDYEGRAPLLVGVLRGASVFLTDLVRAIDLPVSMDFIAVSSYGSATQTSGVVRLVKDLDEDLTDRHVILVEDIVDTGLTLRYLRKIWAPAARPASRWPRCWPATRPTCPAKMSATSASKSPMTPSSSATASTSISGTATWATSRPTSKTASS